MKIYSYYSDGCMYTYMSKDEAVAALHRDVCQYLECSWEDVLAMAQDKNRWPDGCCEMTAEDDYVFIEYQAPELPQKWIVTRTELKQPDTVSEEADAFAFSTKEEAIIELFKIKVLDILRTNWADNDSDTAMAVSLEEIKALTKPIT